MWGGGQSFEENEKKGSEREGREGKGRGGEGRGEYNVYKTLCRRHYRTDVYNNKTYNY